VRRDGITPAGFFFGIPVVCLFMLKTYVASIPAL
jgi:hypothetical protein